MSKGTAKSTFERESVSTKQVAPSAVLANGFVAYSNDASYLSYSIPGLGEDRFRSDFWERPASFLRPY